MPLCSRGTARACQAPTGDTVTPAVTQGGTWESQGKQGMLVLGEDGVVILVIVKLSRAGLGMAVTWRCLPACRRNGEG